ncbi:MAG: hypothetical protein Q8L29_03100 [archaeon]|nr:hypothetical protein [archaeon]
MGLLKLLFESSAERKQRQAEREVASMRAEQEREEREFPKTSFRMGDTTYEFVRDEVVKENGSDGYVHICDSCKGYAINRLKGEGQILSKILYRVYHKVVENSSAQAIELSKKMKIVGYGCSRCGAESDSLGSLSTQRFPLSSCD